MKEPGDKPGACAARRRTATLYVLLLASAVFAAWQVHKFIRARQGGRAPAAAPSQDTWRYQAETRPAEGDAESLLGLTSSWSRITPIHGDPGDVAPPDGAKRRYAFRPDIAQADVQLGSYEYAGTYDDAAGHYNDVLCKRGYRLLADTAVKGGRRLIVFGNNESDVKVLLRRAGAKGNIVSILVAVTRTVR